MINFSFKGAERSFVSFNGAVAMLAASSAAFLAFAMPADLFSRLVAESGLPDLIAAAAPPLGMKARFAVVALVAIATFIPVWALLRALDHVPARRQLHDGVDLPEAAPRLRRADLHPDAPPRPPVRAGRDFGEPLDMGSPDLSEPVAADEVEPLELDMLAIDPEPETLSEASDLIGSPFDSGLDDGPGIEAESGIAFEAETDFEPEIERQIAPEPAADAEGHPAAIEALAAPLPDAADESVSNLMRRLEGGLERRERAQSVDQVEETASPVTDQPAGHRLRNAINDLERMAKRG